MKQIIRAFALGLATATALLTFTYYQTNETNEKRETKAFTDQEAITQLENKDYHILSQSSYKELTKQNQIQSTKATSKKGEKETNNKEKGQEDSENKSYSITIEPGMLTSEISESLAQNGIIDDKEKFEIYLQNHDYSRSLQIGTYKVDQGMTYENIAKKISEQE